MDIMKPTAVIGTNSWGGKLYGMTLRGSYVEDEVIKDAMKTAKEKDIALFDLARDYGLGKAEKMIGEFGTEDIVISAKYTPFTHYKPGCVRKSLMKDLRDFKRDYVEVFWLHLPTDIEDHLKEIIELYNEGLIKYIGVSNFTLEECKLSKRILDAAESDVNLVPAAVHDKTRGKNRGHAQTPPPCRFSQYPFYFTGNSPLCKESEWQKPAINGILDRIAAENR